METLANMVTNVPPVLCHTMMRLLYWLFTQNLSSLHHISSSWVSVLLPVNAPGLDFFPRKVWFGQNERSHYGLSFSFHVFHRHLYICLSRPWLFHFLSMNNKQPLTTHLYIYSTRVHSPQLQFGFILFNCDSETSHYPSFVVNEQYHRWSCFVVPLLNIHVQKNSV